MSKLCISDIVYDDVINAVNDTNTFDESIYVRSENVLKMMTNIGTCLFYKISN